MINDIQKLALAISFAVMSDDMTIKMVKIPKLKNYECSFINSKDGDFEQLIKFDNKENIDEIFRNVVGCFYSKVVKEEMPKDLSKEEVYDIADGLFHGYFLSERGIRIDSEKLFEKLSNGELFLKEDIDFVNKGSMEHLVLTCAKGLLTGTFYFLTVNSTREEKDTLDLKDCLYECYEYANAEARDTKRKWRKKKEAPPNDYRDKEIARFLTYGLLAKNVNLKFSNDLQADNTLRVEFDSAGDSRFSVYFHNKDVEYDLIGALKDSIIDSILVNNFRSQYVNSPEIIKELEVRNILKEDGFSKLSVQDFLEYYLNKGLNMINVGIDSNIINAIILNIASFMNIGKGCLIDLDNDMLTGIQASLDTNFELSKHMPKLAYESAFIMNKLMSDFYK